MLYLAEIFMNIIIYYIGIQKEYVQDFWCVQIDYRYCYIISISSLQSKDIA